MVGFARRLLVACASSALVAIMLISPARGAVGATGINVALPTGFHVSGQVMDASNTPLGDISVGICTDDPTSCSGSVNTAADGTFTIAGVSAGTYFAMADGESARNFLNTFYDGVSGTSDPNAAMSFTVSGDTTGINIVMVPGVTLDGTITDPDNNPVEGVEIDVGGSLAGSSVTNASGHYAVGGLASGFYNVRVTPPSGSSFTTGYVDGGTIVENFVSGVTMDGDTTLDLQLIQGRTISGNLSGLTRPADVSPTGTTTGGTYPVAGNGDFAISGLWPDVPVGLDFAERSAPFNDQFPIGVYDGSSTLTIDQNAAATIDLSGGDVSGLALSVPTTPSLQGHISGEDGVTPAGWLSLCGNGGCASAPIQGDGSYAFWNLPNDTYTLRVNSLEHVNGYVTSSGGVDLNPSNARQISVNGADVTVDATLPTGYTISGRITGPSGEAVVGAAASAEGLGIPFGRAATTDANGDYLISGVPAGDYVIFVGAPELGNYFSGYWSPTGYTADFGSAGTLHIPSGPPTVTSTTPSSGATSVSRIVHVAVTFSASVANVRSTTVWLHERTSTKVLKAKLTYDDATHTATIQAVATLKPRTTYVVEINGVTGTDGTPVAPTSITFTTSK